MAPKTSGGSSASLMNTVSPSELVVGLNKLINVNRSNIERGKKRFGIFVHGAAGAGKSALIAALAKSKNYKLIDLRLPQTDPTDLRGIPVPHMDAELNEMVVDWATPRLFPRADENSRVTTIKKNIFEMTGEEGEKDHWDGAIVFLDELSNAPPMVQNAAYQLVLDGQLGDYRLPDNVFVIAAGNRREDKGGTFEMLGPLRNRFYHLNLISRWEDFFEHAIEQKFHPSVVSYLESHQADLNTFTANSSSQAFATPRSWEAVSNLLTDDTATPFMLLQGLIAGTIGDGVAATFCAHLRNSEVLPNPMEILDGKTTKLDNKLESSLQRHLAISLCYLLKETEEEKGRILKRENNVKTAEYTKFEDMFYERIDNFFGFIQDNFKKELIALSAKIFFASYGIYMNPKRVPNYQRFTRDYKDMLMDAIQKN